MEALEEQIFDFCFLTMQWLDFTTLPMTDKTSYGNSSLPTMIVWVL